MCVPSSASCLDGDGACLFKVRINVELLDQVRGPAPQMPLLRMRVRGGVSIRAGSSLHDLQGPQARAARSQSADPHRPAGRSRGRPLRRSGGPDALGGRRGGERDADRGFASDPAEPAHPSGSARRGPGSPASGRRAAGPHARRVAPSDPGAITVTDPVVQAIGPAYFNEQLLPDPTWRSSSVDGGLRRTCLTLL